MPTVAAEAPRIGTPPWHRALIRRSTRPCALPRPDGRKRKTAAVSSRPQVPMEPRARPPRPAGGAPTGPSSCRGSGPATELRRPGRIAYQTARRVEHPRCCAQLPARAVDLTVVQRDALGRWLRTGWPDGAKELYAALSDDVARASARRWAATLGGAGSQGEAMIWRLLRIGSAPYFVLGSSAERSLRLRIATSWDWRQRYQLRSIAVEPQPGGQPRVGWRALVRDRASHEVHEVAGHIEVRWSHGRFGGLPEAKGYLDTPHHLVPGYFTLR